MHQQHTAHQILFIGRYSNTELWHKHKQIWVGKHESGIYTHGIACANSCRNMVTFYSCLLMCALQSVKAVNLAGMKHGCT